MGYEVKMPKFGETMTEGTINIWLKNVGDRIEEGEPLLEISTDKANLEVEADKEGYLGNILYEKGDTVPIGEIIAVIVENKDEVGKAEITAEPEVTEAKAEAEQKTTVRKDEPEIKEESMTDEKSEPATLKIKASPAARKLAADYQISLEDVSPAGGRDAIIAEDVKSYHSSRPEITPIAREILLEKGISSEEIPEKFHEKNRITKNTVKNYIESLEKPEEVKAKRESGELLELTEIRRVTAERMKQSFKEVPHVTHNMKVNMKEMIGLRKRINEKIDQHITFNDLIVFAVSRALRNYPEMNAHYKNNSLFLQKQINIGIAIDTDEGLVVPVIKKVDRKGLKEIAIKREDLVEKSQAGKLRPEDFEGGTFTVSNLGNYDIESFTPIINQPEIGILGVGKITRQPWVVNDKVVIRPINCLSLSFDHRGIDGAPAAEFLQLLKDLLENPEELII